MRRLRTWLGWIALWVVILWQVPGSALRAEPTAQEVAPGWWPRIAIVWPHDAAGNAVPVSESSLVNVSVWPRDRAECDDRRASRFRLLVAAGNEPADAVGEPDAITYRRVAGGAFPSLEFNDVPADLRDAPGARYAFVVYGEETLTRPDLAGNVWVHAADPRTLYPEPVVPTGFAETAFLSRPDARIQVVWPHDGRGRPAPVEAATHVNVAVEVFARGTLRAAVRDEHGFHPFSLGLLKAEGNGPLERVPIDAQETTYDVGGQPFPRWVFNNVPVTPGVQTHFVVSVLTLGAKATSPHSTVWTHAADARTLLPDPQPPPACVPSPRALDPETAHAAVVRSHCEGAAPSSCYGSLFAVDPDGGDAVNLTPHSPANYYHPAYSPDGQWIAFTSDRDATRYDMAIFLVRADGGGLRQVSRRYFQTYGPVFWSRDGRHLAIRYPGDGKYHVYTLEGEGPETVDVLGLEEWIWPNDSPDGRWRARPCGHPGDRPLADGWCLAPLEGQEGNPFAMSLPGLGRVAWSPDGERVALCDAGKVYVVGRDGSGRLELGEGHSPTWQPMPAGG